MARISLVLRDPHYRSEARRFLELHGFDVTDFDTLDSVDSSELVIADEHANWRSLSNGASGPPIEKVVALVGSISCARIMDILDRGADVCFLRNRSGTLARCK